MEEDLTEYTSYWGNQAKINGQLCRVDWKLIQALKLVNAIFVAMKTPVDEELLKKLDEAIKGADLVSSKVAEIKPPGCIPPLREDPADPDSAYTTSAAQSPTG